MAHFLIQRTLLYRKNKWKSVICEIYCYIEKVIKNCLPINYWLISLHDAEVMQYAKVIYLNIYDLCWALGLKLLDTFMYAGSQHEMVFHGSQNILFCAVLPKRKHKQKYVYAIHARRWQERKLVVREAVLSFGRATMFVAEFVRQYEKYVSKNGDDYDDDDDEGSSEEDGNTIGRRSSR